ncbi:MAG: hypothetical protein LBT93_03890 [Treponema sp.]|nr:hypothetical protein [Treponema sp.]
MSFLLLALCSGGIFPQESPEARVFAPFVSRISAEVKNNLIRLSWIDSVDIRGPVYIYRSILPFDETHSPARIQPIEVPYGAQSYIDEQESSGTLYYYVAASDTSGQRYDIYLPYNNMVSVTLGNLPGQFEGRQNLSPAASGIFSLEAKVEEDRVVIRYRTVDGSKDTVLYRSVRPITQTADLLNAVIVQSGVTTPFADYPVPGIPYYYAIIFEEELTTGQVGIFPGYNATITAVEIPAGRYRVGLPGSQEDIRSIPLPEISRYTTLSGANVFSDPPPIELSAEAARAVAGLGAPKKSPSRPDKFSRVFAQDLEAPAGGEDYTLRTIVQGPFIKQDWNSAREELIRFLSLPRSETSEARARFYLGQSYYFSGYPREALFEFLMMQSYHPEETGGWIQATLANLIRG